MAYQETSIDTFHINVIQETQQVADGVEIIKIVRFDAGSADTSGKSYRYMRNPPRRSTTSTNRSGLMSKMRELTLDKNYKNDRLLVPESEIPERVKSSQFYFGPRSYVSDRKLYASMIQTAKESSKAELDSPSVHNSLEYDIQD